MLHQFLEEPSTIIGCQKWEDQKISGTSNGSTSNLLIIPFAITCFHSRSSRCDWPTRPSVWYRALDVAPWCNSPFTSFAWQGFILSASCFADILLGPRFFILVTIVGYKKPNVCKANKGGVSELHKFESNVIYNMRKSDCHFWEVIYFVGFQSIVTSYYYSNGSTSIT